MKAALLGDRKILYKRVNVLLLKILKGIPNTEVKEIKSLDEIIGKINGLTRLLEFKK